MNILAIDTSGAVASAAVFSGGEVVAFLERGAMKDHSGSLLPLCRDVLQKAGMGIVQIDEFAAAAGPGSFTGVRIGIAAVKGFAWTQSKPCAAISTLHAIACAARVDGLLCCRVTAREGEWYYAFFERKSGQVSRLTDDAVAAQEQIDRQCAQFSDVIFVDNAQNAIGVALAAAQIAQGGQAHNCHEIAPVYLKKPQAQRLLEEKLAAQGAVNSQFSVD